ncbi:CbiX domain-containing protein [Cephalotus follicularis]|uniref:CbiX domain-containing protein n=1 Tax=Cephalotus follicularis TaxID=3775 RepID=A0A1Q3AZU9_CEPFO|nr:CbiX domain-containing protein [Cephalotus follicularis]
MPIDSLSNSPHFTISSYSFSVNKTCENLRRPLPKFLKSQKDPSRSRNLSTRSCLNLRNGGIRQYPHGVSEKDGVIIVDHGSRRKESNLMLNEFVAMFRDKTGYKIIEPAHMELAEPSIKDAFGLCVQQGADRVIVSPFFLSPGRHWYQDIPSLTAEAAKEHTGVTYIVTAPLGLHDLLVDVVNDRIKHCLSHIAGDESECAVCVGTNKCRLY